MVVSYGTSTLPSSVINVREQTTTAVSLAFDNAVGIVGGYDASNGSITSSDENTNIEIEGTDDALEKFGEDSELYRQVRLAFLNGAGRIVCTPVGESETTESVSGTASITLSETAIDPRTNPEEEITAVDTSSGTDITVNIVDGTPTTPSASDALNINPYTGEGEFSSSSEYDVTYTVGDYDSAVSEAAKADVRFSGVCSSDTSAVNGLLASANERAQGMDFKRAVGAVPTDVDPDNYSVIADDQRLVLAAPALGTAFDAKASLVPAIAAQMASEGLGGSATGNGIAGFDSIDQEFSITETTDFGDGTDVDRVTVVRDGLDGLEIVEDLTTSTGEKFDDVYRCEIIDDITYSLHVVADDFIDSNQPNTATGRDVSLEAPARSVLRSASNNSPPLLSSVDGSKPYTVSTSAGANDETARLEVGIDVTGIAKTVIVNVGVGAVQSYNEPQ